MSVIRIIKDKDNPYVMLNIIWVQDRWLSRKWTGLLTYLLSLPNDREINVSDLRNRKKDGETSVNSAIDELIDHWYLVRGERKRKPNGWLWWYDYELHESSLNWIKFCDPDWKTRETESYPWKSKIGKSYPWKSQLGKSQDNNNTEEENKQEIDNSNIIYTLDEKNPSDSKQKSTEEKKEKSSAKKEKKVWIESTETIDPIVEDMMNIQKERLAGVKYQVESKWEQLYLQEQQWHLNRLLKDMKKYNLTKEHLKVVIDRVLNDSFRKNQIWSIGKLRQKNKDKIPYRVVFVEKIKTKLDNMQKVENLDRYK